MAFGHAKLAIKNDRTRQQGDDDDLANRTTEKYIYITLAGRPPTTGDRNGDDMIIRFFGWTIFWALLCTCGVDKCVS